MIPIYMKKFNGTAPATHKIKVKKLSSLVGKIKGNMFREEIIPISFETRFGIHTFFVKKPMDAVILNKENRTTKIKTGLLPWRVLLWNPSYYRVIELPNNFARIKKLKIGDTVIY
jgi:uncharacterized membrane protein (UPF0127 family)